MKEQWLESFQNFVGSPEAVAEHLGGNEVPWTTLGEYLEFLEEKGISTNVASFLGAATVRESTSWAMKTGLPRKKSWSG